MAGVDGRFRRLEAYLEGRKFLVGDSFTLADITMATCLLHAYMKFFYPEKRNQYPICLKYYEKQVEEGAN